MAIVALVSLTTKETMKMVYEFLNLCDNYLEKIVAPSLFSFEKISSLSFEFPCNSTLNKIDHDQ